MELLSPLHISDGRSGTLGVAAEKVEVGANRLINWLSDKARQFRSIAGNKKLAKALFSAETAPVEGTRLRVGETINIYHADGSRTRLRICGVRSGGFSNAYTVIDLDEMQAYCLKENRAIPGNESEKNRSLSVEAEISLRLGRHPHIVAARSAFYYRSRLYLLTEYLPDESLDALLRRRRVSVSEAVDYGIQICRAMEYSRNELPGFVHGDIKPGNCLLDSDGRLKLGDFGLSSAIGIGGDREPVSGSRSDSDVRSSRRGWGGTTPYMAPEMFDRQSNRVNSDIYALGVTLFEMVAGVRPFSHSSRSDLVEMHRSADLPVELLKSKSIPEPLVALIARCLAKSPAGRPQSFREAELRLSEIAADPVRLRVPDENPAEDSKADFAETIAMSFARIGRFETAAAMIDKAIARVGRSAELLASKAIILLSGSRVEAAYEASTAALMMRADLFLVLLAHGRVLIARGNLENAREYLERAHEIEPGNCVVLNLLGDVCRRSGDYDSGIKYLRRSHGIDSAQTEAQILLARIKLDHGRTAEATELAGQVLVIDADCAEANCILADARSQMGDIVEAVKAYKTALCQSGESVDLRHRYVRACLSLFRPTGKGGKRRVVRTLLLGARLLQANSLERKTADHFVEEVLAGMAEHGAGIVFFHDLTIAKLADGPGIRQRHRLSRELKAFHNAAVVEPLPCHIQYSIGRVFYHLDELDDCKIVFRSMLDRFGPNESSYYFLAACSEIRQEYAAALKYYQKANQLLNCEDSRTGVRRVTNHLARAAKSIA